MTGISDLISPNGSFATQIKASTQGEEYEKASEIVNTIDSDELTAKQTAALETYTELAPTQIIVDANKDLSTAKIPSKSVNSVRASVQSVILRKLLEKYGTKFIKKRLPKKIYKKFPKIVKKKVKFKKFKSFWNDALLGSVASSASALTYKFLRKCSVPKVIAKSASAVVWSVVWWYIS
ncbi:hypothetical protein [Lactiplantibacillus plantarum]|nr:hypothetical protein [Lactiplantibacillus plantarum]